MDDEAIHQARVVPEADDEQVAVVSLHRVDDRSHDISRGRLGEEFHSRGGGNLLGPGEELFGCFCLLAGQFFDQARVRAAECLSGNVGRYALDHGDQPEGEMQSGSEIESRFQGA